MWETASNNPTSRGQARLKKVVCEMGGKNCVIVDSDADLDEAVVGCVASAFGYQGQKCSALSRLVVLEDNYDKFMARFIAAVASLPVGPAELPGSVFGPVISREAQQRILATIAAGKKKARVAWPGPRTTDRNDFHVPPAIFTAVVPTRR